MLLLTKIKTFYFILPEWFCLWQIKYAIITLCLLYGIFTSYACFMINWHSQYYFLVIVLCKMPVAFVVYLHLMNISSILVINISFADFILLCILLINNFNIVISFADYLLFLLYIVLLFIICCIYYYILVLLLNYLDLFDISFNVIAFGNIIYIGYGFFIINHFFFSLLVFYLISNLFSFLIDLFHLSLICYIMYYNYKYYLLFLFMFILYSFINHYIIIFHIYILFNVINYVLIILFMSFAHLIILIIYVMCLLYSLVIYALNQLCWWCLFILLFIIVYFFFLMIILIIGIVFLCYLFYCYFIYLYLFIIYFNILCFIYNYFSVMYYSHIMYYSCPLNVNYYWNNGFLLFMYYFIQCISGIILACLYCNYYSFYSVINLVREISFGYIYRYIHGNGASFVFGVSFIHIGRSLYYYSMLFNCITWIAGFLIFIFMIIIGFIGYCLPFGQMSFWGATVIFNIISFIPFIIEWFYGSYFICSLSIKRLFIFHYFVSFILIIPLFVHILYLHYFLSNNPLGFIQYFIISFFPYYLSKDLFGLILINILFIILLFNCLSNGHNGFIVNGFVTPLHIVPEWYFLSFYSILKCIKHKYSGLIGLLVYLLFHSLNLENSLNIYHNYFFCLYFLSFYLLIFIGSYMPYSLFILYCLLLLIIIKLLIFNYSNYITSLHWLCQACGFIYCIYYLLLIISINLLLCLYFISINILFIGFANISGYLLSGFSGFLCSFWRFTFMNDVHILIYCIYYYTIIFYLILIIDFILNILLLLALLIILFTFNYLSIIFTLYCISINIYYNYWIIFNFRFYLIGFLSGFIFDIIIGFVGLFLLELNREIIYVSFQCYYFLILLLIFSDWISFISIIMFCSFFYYYSYCIYECLIYFSICFIILMLLLSLISILSLYYLIFLNIQSLELFGFSYHLFIILLHFYHIIFSLYLLIFLCNFIILSISSLREPLFTHVVCLDLNISIKLLEIYFHLIELFYIYLFTLIN